MELDQIRKQINAVDDAMHRYFTDRLRCSEDVAEAKLQTQDSVYKPEREKQVYARFPGDADEEKLYRLYVRKVMQLSRYHQYGIFLGKGNVDTEFETQYRSVQAALNERDTRSTGGTGDVYTGYAFRTWRLRNRSDCIAVRGQ